MEPVQQAGFMSEFRKSAAEFAAEFQVHYGQHHSLGAIVSPMASHRADAAAWFEVFTSEDVQQ
jgi:hypothetical protein